jgi:hypothetical protein
MKILINNLKIITESIVKQLLTTYYFLNSGLYSVEEHRRLKYALFSKEVPNTVGWNTYWTFVHEKI